MKKLIKITFEKKWNTYILSLFLVVILTNPLISIQVSARDMNKIEVSNSPTPIPTLTQTPNLNIPQASPTRFPNAPSEFKLVDADIGVQLFRKDYPDGTPDFVQVVNLGQGASLKFMYGKIVEPRPKKGGFGHADPRMTSLPINSYWQQAKEINDHTLCVTNGLFFYMPEYPTRLAFPLKVDNEFITDGFGFRTYLGEKQMLELWENRANIRELTNDNFNLSTAPNIIGGLTEKANKRAKNAVGRTFMGIADYNEDGIYEIVFLLNTKTALQTSAATVLRSFGANNVMMLDGGGSTQLLCREAHYIESDRPIPQAIAIIAGEPPLVTTEVIEKPEWPILVEGENFNLELKVRNIGIATWTPSTTKIALERSILSEKLQINISQDIRPGQEISISQTLAAFTKPGIFPVELEWGIIYENKIYQGEMITFQIIVLPTNLENKQNEFNESINQWIVQRPEEIEELVLKWIEPHDEIPTKIIEVTPGGKDVQIGNAIIIPLLMLPVLIILAITIGRKRQ